MTESRLTGSHSDETTVSSEVSIPTKDESKSPRISQLKAALFGRKSPTHMRHMRSNTEPLPLVRIQLPKEVEVEIPEDREVMRLAHQRFVSDVTMSNPLEAEQAEELVKEFKTINLNTKQDERVVYQHVSDVVYDGVDAPTAINKDPVKQVSQVDTPVVPRKAVPAVEDEIVDGLGQNLEEEEVVVLDQDSTEQAEWTLCRYR